LACEVFARTAVDAGLPPGLSRPPSATRRRAAARGTWYLPTNDASAVSQCEREMVGSVSDIPGRQLAGTAIKYKHAINA